MGKGDKKTRRGKLFNGSYGVRRTHKSKPALSMVNATKKETAKELSPVIEDSKPAPKEAKPTVKKPAAEVKQPEVKPVRQAKDLKPDAKKPAAKKESKPKEEE